MRNFRECIVYSAAWPLTGSRCYLNASEYYWVVYIYIVFTIIITHLNRIFLCVSMLLSFVRIPRITLLYCRVYHYYTAVPQPNRRSSFTEPKSNLLHSTFFSYNSHSNCPFLILLNRFHKKGQKLFPWNLIIHTTIGITRVQVNMLHEIVLFSQL